VLVEPFKNATIKISPPNLMGSWLLRKSLFLSISFFVYFDSIYNFDNSEREEKRVAMTTELKKEVFTACLVRVLCGILEFGAFKEVGEAFVLFLATVSKSLGYNTDDGAWIPI
jgi:hypothetical protein